MKKVFLFFATLIISYAALGQAVSMSMSNDFKQISGYTSSRLTGFEVFQTYGTTGVIGSPFFNPDWASGSVTTINQSVFSNNYAFIFNKQSQESYIRYKDSVLMVDKTKVNSFTINTHKPHTF